MNKKDLPATKEDISGITADITEMKGDITGMKGDITGMKGDITGMKGDITGMKGDITGMKGDITRLDAKIDASTKRLAMEISRTNGRIDDLKESLTQTMYQQSDRILTALDHSAKLIEANNRAVVLHGSILTNVQLELQDHDRRIQALESAPRHP
jgi:chromosome segregation ATPase